jgi:nucleotide-binding universal stress UspA family protein
MRRFKNILFVNEAGTSSSATPEAVVELARANQAKLTLCDVVQPMPRSFVNMEEKMRTLRQQQLDALLANLPTDDLEVVTVLLEGTPFAEIINQVRRGQHDLLIKNAEVSGIADNSFGASDMHLMRKCPCPLWIARSDNFGHYRSIVAAVDVDASQPNNAELNHLILDLASSLARENKCSLHIVHAWALPNEALLRTASFNLLGDKLDEIIETTQAEHASQLDELLASRNFDGIEHQVHLGKGKPANYILSVAGMVDADLVVMGTVSHTDVPGLFMGTTAERILSKLGSSVLTVKPAGFKTPVT